MISSLDSFVLSFDSIKVGPNAPETTAGEAAALGEDYFADPPGAAAPLLFGHEDLPHAEAPGFYLLDDASGRFAIDRETGVISVAHDHLLASEAGAIHPVHIKVIEGSGASYEQHFSLRITGRVPQLAGHEDDALGALAAAPLLDLISSVEPAPEATATIKETPAPRVSAPAPAPAHAWTLFSAAAAPQETFQHLGSEGSAFGTLLEAPGFSDASLEPGQLTLNATPPRPADADAVWLI